MRRHQHHHLHTHALNPARNRQRARRLELGEFTAGRAVATNLGLYQEVVTYRGESEAEIRDMYGNHD
ncbi:hypothetical protein [Streptomyces sp. NPDC001787]|uniref:hypothetical protein n=1 Tax=Streptomyces sp. NPDC001787 TaxID=3154523 RepID=UPI00332920D4